MTRTASLVLRGMAEFLRRQHYVQAVAAVRIAVTLFVGVAVLIVSLTVERTTKPLPTAPLWLIFAVTLALNGYVYWRSARRPIDHLLVPLAALDTMLIGVATVATGGIASPLQILLLLPIGQVAVTVSMRSAFGISLLSVAVYSILFIDPISSASIAFIQVHESAETVLEKFINFNIIVTDITFVAFAAASGWVGEALRRHEGLLLKRSSRLRGEVLMLSRLAKTSSRQTDLAPVLETVLQTVCVELGVERAGVFIIDPLSPEAAPSAAATHGIEEADAFVAQAKTDAGSISRVVRERKIVVQEYRHRSRGRGIEPAAITAPLLIGSDCLGCLYLDAGLSNHRWGRDSVDLLMAIADLTAVAVHNARLFSAAASEQLKLEATFGAVSDAILLYDTDGKVLLANRRFVDLFGLPGQIRGLSVAKLPALGLNPLRPTDVIDVEQAEAVWSQLLESEEDEAQLFVPARTFQRRAAPVFDEQGQEFATILTLHDVTDEQQAAQAREEILSSVSHELRTPLTTVKGYTQIFLRRLQRGDQHFTEHEFHLMLDQIDRLSQLVDELLDVSRLPGRNGHPRQAPVDLRELTRSVVDRAATGRPSRKIELTAPSQPLVGRWNGARISQALDNLLNNALKFSPDETSVYVQMSASDGCATVSFRDHGIGVPGEHASQIFEPFFRVDNSTTRRTGGLGLGLYVTKLIAEQHGGTLSMESVPGTGSTFKLSLPLEP